MVVAPRFMATLIPEPDKVPCGEEVWGDSFLVLPEGSGTTYRNVLTNEIMTTGDESGRPVLPLAELFADAPIAFLESVGGA